MTYDHDFKWNNVKILDSELSYNKRLISEMVYIKKQENVLNKQSDTESFSDSCFPIIQLLSSF